MSEETRSNPSDEFETGGRNVRLRAICREEETGREYPPIEGNPGQVKRGLKEIVERIPGATEDEKRRAKNKIDQEVDRAAEMAQRLKEKLESKPENIRKEIEDVLALIPGAAKFLLGFVLAFTIMAIVYVVYRPWWDYQIAVGKKLNLIISPSQSLYNRSVGRNIKKLAFN